MDRRYENNYRLPEKVINRWTRICVTVLIGSIVVGFGAGAGGGATGDAADDRHSAALGVVSVVLLVIAIVFGAGGFVFALGASAYLGGESLQRGGGWVGILLIIGLLGASAGWALGPVWGVAGIVVMVLGVVGLILMGVRARVPMWLQLPILRSPRFYYRGRAKEDPNEDTGDDTDDDTGDDSEDDPSNR